jgi:hypothetical protein
VAGSDWDIENGMKGALSLSRGVGLGGRARRAGRAAERARVNVQRRLTEAIRRIEEAHAPLGMHLRKAIRTGAFCSYAPERAERIWRWPIRHWHNGSRRSHSLPCLHVFRCSTVQQPLSELRSRRRFHEPGACRQELRTSDLTAYS